MIFRITFDKIHFRQLYEFWVSATTGLGEGEATTIVTQTTNTRAPARVASFSQLLRRAVKSSITLSCLVVGNPTPRPIWTYRNGQVSTGRHYEFTPDGHLHICGMLLERQLKNFQSTNRKKKKDDTNHF